MPAQLVLHLPGRPSKICLVREGAIRVVGREPSCDIVVDDDRISRRHASLEAAGGGWTLEDLSSKNGTAIDGRPVERETLTEDTWISFGGVLGHFRQISEEAAERRGAERLRQWQTSLRMQRELTPEVGLQELLDRLLSSVLQITGAERGFVMLTDAQGELRILSISEIEPAELSDREFSGSLGAIERALQQQRTVTTSDALADTGLGQRPSVVASGIRALACLPLSALDRTLGVIYADSRKLGAVFDELDIEILEALAGHAALAIAVARIDTELKGLAETLATNPDIAVEARDGLADDLSGLVHRSLPQAEASSKFDPTSVTSHDPRDSDAG